MFHRLDKTQSTSTPKKGKNLTRIMPAKDLLIEKKRPTLVHKIKHYMALPNGEYNQLCASLLNDITDYYQSLPETANSYYAEPGGLLDHALNRTEAALELLQDFFALDETTSTLSKMQRLWQYLLFSAALLKGVACLYLDYSIQLFDAEGRAVKPWNPLLEKPADKGQYYSYEFQAPPEPGFRNRLTLLLARQLMPLEGFAWIASDPQVLAVWLALLNEDSRGAGTLGALLIRAEAIAQIRYFNELPIRASSGRGGPYGRTGTFIDTAPTSLLDKEKAVGMEFLRWLTESLESGRIMINKAPLFMVPGGLFLAQEVFKDFLKGHPQYGAWQAVQKGFLALGLPCKAIETSSNALKHALEKQIHGGLVLADYALVLPKSVTVSNEANKSTTMSALEFIHKAQQNSQFKAHQVEVGLTELQKLNARGEWQAMEAGGGAPQVGVKYRG